MLINKLVQAVKQLNKEIKSLNNEIEVSKAESKKMDEEMKNIINLYLTDNLIVRLKESGIIKL